LEKNGRLRVFIKQSGKIFFWKSGGGILLDKKGGWWYNINR
jgi:hypothetical protein